MDEEDSFCITTHLIEEVIAPDYYNSMIGVLCDDRILEAMISLRLPKIKEKITEMGVNTSVFSI